MIYDRPNATGTWRSASSSDTGSFRGLTPGRKYRIAKPFRDFDGELHPEGETWIYLGRNFLPYEDGLSLFVSLDGPLEWHIRMRWTPEDQGLIIDKLSEYIRTVD